MWNSHGAVPPHSGLCDQIPRTSSWSSRAAERPRPHDLGESRQSQGQGLGSNGLFYPAHEARLTQGGGFADGIVNASEAGSPNSLDRPSICLTNNAAEHALRGFALGRKSWLFAGSERGAERSAVMATLISTAKMNDVDPQASLADVLARIAEPPAHRLDDLLPWNWRPLEARVSQAA